MTTPLDDLRAHLVRALDWEEAHAGFDKAVDGLPDALRGARAAGFEHTPWQLVEHLRLAQEDLLDFCVNRDYVHDRTWPDDYWPRDPAPPDAQAWEASLAAFRADLERLKTLVRDTSLKPTADVSEGDSAGHRSQRLPRRPNGGRAAGAGRLAGLSEGQGPRGARAVRRRAVTAAGRAAGGRAAAGRDRDPAWRASVAHAATVVGANGIARPERGDGTAPRERTSITVVGSGQPGAGHVS